MYWTETQAFFFFKKQMELCIGEKDVGSILQVFILRIKQVVDGKLQLHESVPQNLGMMYNEYCYNLPHITSKFFMKLGIKNKSSSWVGLDYKVWSTYNTTTPMATTWLYNDCDGNIILEVTPLYRWSFFPDDPEDPNSITYNEFMKNYKPLIRRVVSREIALVWLEQTTQFYRSLFKNEEDYKRACDRMNW